MRQVFSATEREVRQLWEQAFGAAYPEQLDYKIAFESVFLQKGGEWIANNLRGRNETAD